MSEFRGSQNYVASEELMRAVNIAMVLQKPLLIKGEPGTGKTMLAEAISQSLDKKLIIWNIKSTTKAQDGLYVYDVVQRLYDSQFGGEGVDDIAKYVRLGKLGEAFSSDEQVILLIDEIDKADLEFPNDLLWELDRMEFHIPETGETVTAKHRPVVIITSNAEKELPDAFLRRCVFHYIEFPDQELMAEIEKSIAAGVMKENPYKTFRVGDMSKENYSTEHIDLHRPYVDSIVLVSSKGEPMRREADLIDVWFDSGAMPYAQAHYPFENREHFSEVYPADFIAEGVDQTRGWFFTLHAIATMLFDSVAFKNIISNGLVLDKNGNKMSKRLGNAVDPFEVLDTYGPDATRWYMISNSQPWDNLKFDRDGVDEVRRKFFGTLYNTYSFFALYANVDSFTGHEAEVPLEKRPEIDRWILSLLNSLVRQVTEALENYDPTPAARAIQEFVGENLSNWYVRLNRKRFWGGGMSEDKLAAYQTLYTCLETVVMLSAPFAPFISDRIFRDLNAVSGRHTDESVHLSTFPKADEKCIDARLEERMDLAQRVSSMVLALRRKVSIKVRQPLMKILIPVLDPTMAEDIAQVRDLIMNEVNVKDIELIENTAGIITKRIKPNFKTLGPRYGKYMKQIAAMTASFSQERIAEIEAAPETVLDLGEERISVTAADFEITSEDMPGWLVASEGKLTVALDITLTDELRAEGVARELINRIQNIRKDAGFEVTDKIRIEIEQLPFVADAVARYADYIAAQTLAVEVRTAAQPAGEAVSQTDVDEQPLRIAVTRI